VSTYQFAIPVKQTRKLRTYGRIVPDPLYPDTKQWVEVTTDDNGFDDMVWLTTLIQTIKLNLGESPFWSDYGIPAHRSVVTQIAPDFYMQKTQQNYAQYFMSLMIQRVPDQADERGVPSPTYYVSAITQYGAKVTDTVNINRQPVVPY
jgi:hypothetical protein